MTLREQIRVLSDIPTAIGTEYGEAWLVYYEKQNEAYIPDELLDRGVIKLHLRKGGYKSPFGCTLKGGYGIIIEGSEEGSI